MNALVILIPITLVLASVAVGIFFWAVRHDQFEDLDSPKILPLLDEIQADASDPVGTLLTRSTSSLPMDVERRRGRP